LRAAIGWQHAAGAWILSLLYFFDPYDWQGFPILGYALHVLFRRRAMHAAGSEHGRMF
jgi:hypothetical protein